MAKNKSFGVILVAGLVGAALGLLFAPRSGKEMRKELKTKADDVKDRAVVTTEKIKKIVKENAGEVKKGLERSAKEMSDLGEEAKIRASRIADDARETSSKVEKNVKREIDEEFDDHIKRR